MTEAPGVADLEAFDAAVRAFPSVDRLTMEWSPQALECAERSLQRHGLCLVGEVHGVAETPLVIERLVAELGVRTVALEWPRGLERVVDDLALLGTDPPALGGPIGETTTFDLVRAAAWFGDGRVTAGHFAVLRRIDARVVAVDEPLVPPGRDARDAAMARNLERALRSHPGPALFVAGNLHARLRRHEHYLPVGAHLARERPDLCALEIHYASGGFWNDGPRRFDPSAPPAGPHVVVPDATAAVVLAR